jgi:hypothetical protein
MLTAYLDESGHEGRELVILAGFLGTAEQWEKCEAEWRSGLGKRKRLHMRKLRWSSRPEHLKSLLSTLGPIPHASGLQAVFSAVKVADYEDLVDGTVMQKLMKGYHITLLGVIDIIAKNIPEDETFRLVLEAQDTYEVQAKSIFKATDSNRTPDGRHKLVSLEYIGKSILTEPADYLAYALLQLHLDRKSMKSEFCAPILKNTRPALARDHLAEKDKVRQFVKGMVERHPNLMRTAT